MQPIVNVVRKADNLVNSHRGTMPIILTCPHDGTEAPPNVPERTGAPGCTGSNEFGNNQDHQTAGITEGVAQKIFDLTGLLPYVVIARFSRKFIDANRSRNCAFTDPRAAFFYDQYHTYIRNFVREILSQNGNRGFLFDIHGTGENSADIYLGTREGTSLVNGITREDLYVQHGLYGLLTQSWSPQTIPNRPRGAVRYRVSPADATTPGILGGAFTLSNYSSMNISCIQLEISNTIRNDRDRRNLLKEDLAFALINFVRRHAPF